MKIVIDTETGKAAEGVREMSLFSPAGYGILSQLTRKIGLDQNCEKSFSWWGQPTHEHPDVLFRLQDVIFHVQPKIIVQSGKTQAGSLLFLAGVLRLLGGGKVIGIDSEILFDAQSAISQHPFAADISLVTGDLIAEETITQLKQAASAEAKVLLILNSRSDKSDVRERLETYAPQLTVGSVLVLTDFLSLGEWHDVRLSQAFTEFAMEHSEFRLEEPVMLRRVK